MFISIKPLYFKSQKIISLVKSLKHEQVWNEDFFLYDTN